MGIQIYALYLIPHALSLMPYTLNLTPFTFYSFKNKIMRTFGIVLIIVGILMLIVPSINFTRKEKVVDIGPIEINKTENKVITWPYYAGGLVTIAGIVLLLANKRK